MMEQEMLAVQRRRVIVIDDDQLFLRAICRATSEDEVDLAVASTGEAALALVESRPADVAVVDLRMPGVDGIEVCRRLRASVHNIIVVVATSHLDQDVRDQARRAGAMYALEKPYNVAKLVASIAVTFPTPAELIEKHLDVARNIAGRLSRAYQTILAADEIEALARLGLCEAAARFDATRSDAFLPFAVQRIRGAIIDEIRRTGSQTRGGRAREGLVIAEANDEEIAAWHTVTEDSPQVLVERSEALDRVAKARTHLSRIDQAIIEMHYENEMSFAAIAKVIGVSSGRMAQLHARLLDRLRAAAQLDD